MLLIFTICLFVFYLLLGLLLSLLLIQHYYHCRAGMFRNEGLGRQRRVGASWDKRLCYGHVAYVGPCWGGLFWATLELCWVYVEPCNLLWCCTAIFGPCWGMLQPCCGAILAHVARLSQISRWPDLRSPANGRMDSVDSAESEVSQSRFAMLNPKGPEGRRLPAPSAACWCFRTRQKASLATLEPHGPEGRTAGGV